MAITIKRARRVVDLVTDLGLQEQYTDALRAMDAARGDTPYVAMEVGESAEVREAAELVQKIEADMQASTLRFTIEAVDRLRWNEHMAKHPARDDNEADKAQGFDVSSIDGLLPESIKSVHDFDGKPYDFDPKAEWADLSAAMSDGQWSDFASAVIVVNRGTDAPKSRAASLVMRGSDKS